MARLTLDISMSLDGFIAGPNRTVEQPLGDGGDRLHEWGLGLGSWASATECLEGRGTRTTRWCAKRSTPPGRS
jgi:hypothetical protein